MAAPALDRPRSSPAPPPHKPTDHAPVIFPWRLDMGIGLNPDMTHVGHLIRALTDGCEGCGEYWADVAAKGDHVPIVHIMSSAWTRAQLHDVPWRSVFEAEITRDAATAVARQHIKKALKIVQKAGYDERLQILDDATAVLSASTGELLELADQYADLGQVSQVRKAIAVMDAYPEAEAAEVGATIRNILGADATEVSDLAARYSRLAASA